MKAIQFQLLRDKYRNARGGYARFINVYCEKCETLLALYQKDGPGPLRRMYVDRIHAPKVNSQKKEFVCPICKKVIGTFYEYPKEKRWAIRLYQDAVIKKVTRGVFQGEK